MTMVERTPLLAQRAARNITEKLRVLPVHEVKEFLGTLPMPLHPVAVDALTAELHSGPEELQNEVLEWILDRRLEDTFASPIASLPMVIKALIARPYVNTRAGQLLRLLQRVVDFHAATEMKQPDLLAVFAVTLSQYFVSGTTAIPATVAVFFLEHSINLQPWILRWGRLELEQLLLPWLLAASEERMSELVHAVVAVIASADSSTASAVLTKRDVGTVLWRQWAATSPKRAAMALTWAGVMDDAEFWENELWPILQSTSQGTLAVWLALGYASATIRESVAAKLQLARNSDLKVVLSLLRGLCEQRGHLPELVLRLVPQAQASEFVGLWLSMSKPRTQVTTRLIELFVLLGWLEEVFPQMDTTCAELITTLSAYSEQLHQEFAAEKFVARDEYIDEKSRRLNDRLQAARLRYEEFERGQRELSERQRAEAEQKKREAEAEAAAAARHLVKVALEERRAELIQANQKAQEDLALAMQAAMVDLMKEQLHPKEQSIKLAELQLNLQAQLLQLRRALEVELQNLDPISA